MARLRLYKMVLEIHGEQATVSKEWRDYSTLITLGDQVSTISRTKDLMAAGKDLTLTFQQRERERVGKQASQRCTDTSQLFQF